MPKWFLRITTGVALLLFIVAGSLWSYQRSLHPSSLLQVSFLDVGQGDAIYIRAPNGADVLIDGGPDSTVISRLEEVMPSFDHDLSLMVETHPDKDHIAGLSRVLESYEVHQILRSEISSGTSFDESLKAHLDTEPNLERILARRGERIILDDAAGVYLDVLFPNQDTTNFKETNDASIVMRLVYGRTSVLLTGDSPSSVEDFLVTHDGNTLQSTILKLGHHGSKYSTDEKYLDTVKPSWAIVSAGKNNRYHHPNLETLERLESRNIPVLSTIDLGTITFSSNGTNFIQE